MRIDRKALYAPIAPNGNLVSVAPLWSTFI